MKLLKALCLKVMALFSRIDTAICQPSHTSQSQREYVIARARRARVRSIYAIIPFGHKINSLVPRPHPLAGRRGWYILVSQ